MTYSPLDIRMIELFGKKEKAGYGLGVQAGEVTNEEIIRHKEPFLEDIFRMAKNRKWNISLKKPYQELEGYNLTIYVGDNTSTILYEPNLPPIAQPESTKQALVDLFG